MFSLTTCLSKSCRRCCHMSWSGFCFWITGSGQFDMARGYVTTDVNLHPVRTSYSFWKKNWETSGFLLVVNVKALPVCELAVRDERTGDVFGAMKAITLPQLLKLMNLYGVRIHNIRAELNWQIHLSPASKFNPLDGRERRPVNTPRRTSCNHRQFQLPEVERAPAGVPISLSSLFPSPVHAIPTQLQNILSAGARKKLTRATLNGWSKAPMVNRCSTPWILTLELLLKLVSRLLLLLLLLKWGNGS
jgi:hypothetical protein